LVRGKTVRVIFDGIAYDTDTATKIVGGDNGQWSGAWWGLYQAPTGAFFKIVVNNDGETFQESGTLTDTEARTCLEEHANHLVEKHFGPMPEPGAPQLQGSAVRSVMTPPPLLPEHQSELLALKPTFWGVGIDLKEAGRRLRRWWYRGASK
jgi:hypothetical protein